MKIPEPRKIAKNGRTLWKYDFDNYMVRINRFPGDEELFVSVYSKDPLYPNVEIGKNGKYCVRFQSEYCYYLEEKDYVIDITEKAFKIADLLSNHLADLCK